MINFKEVKKLLIPALEMYGFSEKKDKSCQQYKVYSDGSDSLILKRGVNGLYEHYQNKSDNTDYGDVIQLILKRNIPSFRRGGKLDVKECAILEQELAKIDTHSISVPMFKETPKEIFNILNYTLLPITDRALPSSPSSLMIRRRLNVDLSHPDFKDSVALLKSDKGFSSLLFTWRDTNDKIVGAQYKYMKDGGCVKMFLRNSDRSNSLWKTSTVDKSKIFVTEDPLDAIAHRQMYPEKNYAYVCTGGSITINQSILINKLSQDMRLPIVLGCDNDIAGQITNYKVYEPTAIIKKNDEGGTIEITKDNDTQIIPQEQFERFVKVAAAKKGIQVEVPQEPYKDWNDYLLPKKKSEILQIISDKVAKAAKGSKESFKIIPTL